MTMLNPNIHWATIVVDAFVQSGLETVCIAPGSRSTPLTLAFARHAGIQVHRHLDERCASFFALGVALKTDRPVALVCTSGTATANFYPAIIEAQQSQVPLLILTADRPPELRHSGANQTIDQIKLYGDQVLWSVDMALPASDVPAVVYRYLQTTAVRAYHMANGLRKGVVHLNFPFRKPLEPTLPVADTLPITKTVAMGQGMLVANEQQVETLAQIICQCKRGIIICGPRCPQGDFSEAVATLAHHSGYPIFADPLSGVRFGVDAPLVTCYETMLVSGHLPAWEAPEMIIRFGAVPTSKWLNHYLTDIDPRYRVHVRENGVWADDQHHTTHFYQVNEVDLCQKLLPYLPNRLHFPWQEQVLEAEEHCRQSLMEALNQTTFDGAYMFDLVRTLPPQTHLFVGNSLPVRHLDQFGLPTAHRLHIFGNRGASGIDGNISTALGIVGHTNYPMVLAIGDVAFYHDMNGLLAMREVSPPFIIVLFNNNGGGIFHRLPIAQFDPPFTELFATPHDLDFAPVAELYGFDFVKIKDRIHFREQLTERMDAHVPTILEICTDREVDHQTRLSLLQQVSWESTV